LGTFQVARSQREMPAAIFVLLLLVVSALADVDVAIAATATSGGGTGTKQCNGQATVAREGRRPLAANPNCGTRNTGLRA
jgi:hypothetical protein